LKNGNIDNEKFDFEFEFNLKKKPHNAALT